MITWSWVTIQGDTLGAGKHIEFAEHASFDAFRASIPVGTVVIAIEKGGKPLANFVHPPKAVYLLGPEDYGCVQIIVSNLACFLDVAHFRPSCTSAK
jgi:tRNA(Leu) C34 or U34 (ribose-2'-O)-methylase TrmL